MIDNKKDIYIRLKLARLKLNIPSGEFAKKAGIDPRNYSSIESGKRTVGEKVLKDICATYPINMVWLLTGEGEMLKSGNTEIPKKEDQPLNFDEITLRDGATYRLVPVYNFDAVAGMHSNNAVTDAPAYIERYVPFMGAHSGDMCIHVTSRSMIPTYNPGSLLLIRKVEGWREYFGYGHAFVIFLKDGRRILKEVQRYPENPKEYVLCVSHNKEYPPEELPRDMIVDVYKVIVSLTNEGF